MVEANYFTRHGEKVLTNPVNKGFSFFIGNKTMP